MKTISTFILLTLITIGTYSQEYIAVMPQSDHVAELYSPLGSGYGSTNYSYEGGDIRGFNGMATNSENDLIYVLVRPEEGTRFLGILEYSEYTVSHLFDLSDKYAGLTFDDNGNCYAITGDGADDPSALYEINLQNGTQTHLVSFSGAGGDGESIAFNTNNQKMYRFAGGEHFQSFSLDDFLIDSYILDSDIDNYAHALYFDEDTDEFVFMAGDTVYRLTDEGEILDELILELYDDEDEVIGAKGITKNPDYVSIEENSAVEFTLFPNPTVSELNFSDIDKINSVSITQLNGAEVRNIDDITKRMALDLVPGIYMINISLNNGTVQSSKLVIE